MASAVERMQGGLSAGQAQGIGGQGGSVAAAGSVQGDATTVVASVSIATGADGTKGVILPAGSVGDEFTLFNNSGSTLKVWPPTGAAITVVGTGLGSANAAHSLLTFKTGRYICQSSTQYFAIVSA